MVRCALSPLPSTVRYSNLRGAHSLLTRRGAHVAGLPDAARADVDKWGRKPGTAAIVEPGAVDKGAVDRGQGAHGKTKRGGKKSNV